MKKLLSIAMVLCMLSMLMIGCSKEEENVIKIGVFEPTTGENGGGGQQEADGIIYANKINPTVKIGDKTYKVELVIVDNKSDKTEAANAANYLVDQGVVAVIGSYGSGVSIVAGDIFKEAGIPAMGASCTNPQVTLGNDYYFRTCFLDPFQGTVMANYAVKNNAKTAAVITQLGDDYSTGLGQFFESAFKKLTKNESSVVAKATFQQNATDFNAILQNIKAANPDVIFAPSSITTAPLLIKQARALGITCPIMGGDTWENSAIIENAGADSEGVVLSTFFDENNSQATEIAKGFVKGFKEELKSKGKEEIIPAVSALGYDAYIVMIDAINRAGSTDGEAIMKALKATKDFDAVTGTLNFDKNGDAIKNYAIIKIVKNGKFQYYETVTVDSLTE